MTTEVIINPRNWLTSEPDYQKTIEQVNRDIFLHPKNTLNANLYLTQLKKDPENLGNIKTLEQFLALLGLWAAELLQLKKEREEKKANEDQYKQSFLKLLQVLEYHHAILQKDYGKHIIDAILLMSCNFNSKKARGRKESRESKDSKESKGQQAFVVAESMGYLSEFFSDEKVAKEFITLCPKATQSLNEMTLLTLTKIHASHVRQAVLTASHCANQHAFVMKNLYEEKPEQLISLLQRMPRPDKFLTNQRNSISGADLFEIFSSRSDETGSNFFTNQLTTKQVKNYLKSKKDATGQSPIQKLKDHIISVINHCNFQLLSRPPTKDELQEVESGTLVLFEKKNDAWQVHFTNSRKELCVKTINSKTQIRYLHKLTASKFNHACNKIILQQATKVASLKRIAVSYGSCTQLKSVDIQKVIHILENNKIRGQLNLSGSTLMLLASASGYDPEVCEVLTRGKEFYAKISAQDLKRIQQKSPRIKAYVELQSAIATTSGITRYRQIKAFFNRLRNSEGLDRLSQATCAEIAKYDRYWQHFKPAQYDEGLIIDTPRNPAVVQAEEIRMARLSPFFARKFAPYKHLSFAEILRLKNKTDGKYWWDTEKLIDFAKELCGAKQDKDIALQAMQAEIVSRFVKLGNEKAFADFCERHQPDSIRPQNIYYQAWYKSLKLAYQARLNLSFKPFDVVDQKEYKKSDDKDYTLTDSAKRFIRFCGFLGLNWETTTLAEMKSKYLHVWQPEYKKWQAENDLTRTQQRELKISAPDGARIAEYYDAQLKVFILNHEKNEQIFGHYKKFPKERANQLFVEGNNDRAKIKAQITHFHKWREGRREGMQLMAAPLKAVPELIRDAKDFSNEFKYEIHLTLQERREDRLITQQDVEDAFSFGRACAYWGLDEHCSLSEDDIGSVRKKFKEQAKIMPRTDAEQKIFDEIRRKYNDGEDVVCDSLSWRRLYFTETARKHYELLLKNYSRYQKRGKGLQKIISKAYQAEKLGRVSDAQLLEIRVGTWKERKLREAAEKRAQEETEAKQVEVLGRQAAEKMANEEAKARQIAEQKAREAAEEKQAEIVARQAAEKIAREQTAAYIAAQREIQKLKFQLAARQTISQTSSTENKAKGNAELALSQADKVSVSAIGAIGLFSVQDSFSDQPTNVVASISSLEPF